MAKPQLLGAQELFHSDPLGFLFKLILEKGATGFEPWSFVFMTTMLPLHYCAIFDVIIPPLPPFIYIIFIAIYKFNYRRSGTSFEPAGSVVGVEGYRPKDVPVTAAHQSAQELFHSDPLGFLFKFGNVRCIMK